MRSTSSRSTFSVASDHLTIPSKGRILSSRINTNKIRENGVKVIQLKPGDKFGRWSVICEGDASGSGKMWKCRCECGVVRDVLSVRLRHGKSLSCGCLNIERSAAAKWRGVGELGSALWTTVLKGARERGLEVSLTIDEAWELFLKQERKCAITGVLLTMFEYVDIPTNASRGGATGRRVNGTASLDRIDSSKGYCTGNVQWVHKVINQMKSNHPQDVFVEWCRRVDQYTKTRDNTSTATQSRD